MAAVRVARQGPESSSAARRKIAARSSHGIRDQSCQASPAASIACWTSLGAALVDVGEHVVLAVRHHGFERLAGADVLARTSAPAERFEAVMPRRKEHVLADVHQGGANEVQQAIKGESLARLVVAVG